ncbi:dynamin family protein [Lentzea sp. CA-135723]|uniref:Rab family GTPase n=1 Tax=Lentzea sp. CA-135723 TaxID=3239950 RepID=UPI003D9309BC
MTTNSLPFDDRQQARRARIQARADELRSIVADADPDRQCLDELSAADRQLATMSGKVVLAGASGLGKSTLINALYGQIVVPAGAGVTVTGVMITVRPVAEHAEEGVVVRYLTAREHRERLHRLARGLVDLPADLKRKETRQLIAELRSRSTGRGADRADRAAELLAQCLCAGLGAGDVLVGDGAEAFTESFAPGDPRVRSLLTEPEVGTDDDARLRTRLVAEVTIRVVPAAGCWPLGLDLVDLPGQDGSVSLHAEIALEQMRREDAMVVLLLGKAKGRINVAAVDDVIDEVSRNYLASLSHTERDRAAAKFFLVLNDDGVDEAHLRGPAITAALRGAMRGISPGYETRYAGRGRGRACFVVRPLDSLAVENPEAAAGDRESGADYAGSVEFALRRLGRPGSDAVLTEPDKRAIATESEIPLLRSALAGYHRDQRVDRLLDQAEAHVSGALQAMDSTIRARFALHGIAYDAFPRSDDLRQQIGLARLAADADGLRAEIADALDSMRSPTAGHDGAVRAEAVKMAQALGDGTDEEMALWFETVEDHYHGQDVVELRPVRAARVMDAVLVREYRRIGELLADRHLATLAAGVKALVVPVLTRTARELPDATEFDVPAVCSGAVDRFGDRYRAAVGAAAVHELARTVDASLMRLVTLTEQSEDRPDDVAGWAALLRDAIVAKAEVVFDGDPLHHGLRSQFAELWTDLETTVNALAERVLRRRQSAFDTDAAFQQKVLSQADSGLSDVVRLADLRDRLARFRDTADRDEAAGEE